MTIDEELFWKCEFAEKLPSDSHTLAKGNNKFTANVSCVFRLDISDTLSDISVDTRSQVSVSEDTSDNERRVRFKRNTPSCSSGSLDDLMTEKTTP
jgi:hypothetical protein